MVGGHDEFLIILSVPLDPHEIVIAASSTGIRPAALRPRIVNLATPRFLIQTHASRVEILVFPVPHDRTVVIFADPRKFLPGVGDGHLQVPRYSLQVAIVYKDVGISATPGRALGAVIKLSERLSHGWLSY
jgi:hypothetical protein